MEASFKGMHSSDIDFGSFEPAEPDNFGFQLTVFAGPKDDDGEEAFNSFVSTVGWFKENRLRDRPIHGSAHFFVERYDYQALEHEIRSIIASTSGNDWTEIGQKLDRDLGIWEFRNYRE